MDDAPFRLLGAAARDGVNLMPLVIDAALGCIEKGWYHNDDAANEQPWLPNGPIPHTVTWTLPGYVSPGVAYPGNAGRL